MICNINKHCRNVNIVSGLRWSLNSSSGDYECHTKFHESSSHRFWDISVRAKVVNQLTDQPTYLPKAKLRPCLLPEHFVVHSDTSDLYHDICTTAACYSCRWTHFMTSLVVSYWQSFCVCRGDFKERADINLNHERCYCTVRSRWALVYLFHVLRWRARVPACVFYTHSARKRWPTKTQHPPPSLPPPPPQWGSLITLKGQNGHHNEADRRAISKPPTLHCRVQKQQLRPWCYLCHYEMDVAPVIQYSWIMTLRALTNTERGLPHLHRLPPSPQYLTWILYKINTRLVPERKGGGGRGGCVGGAWCVLKLDQWRTEHHTNPASTVTCALTTFLHACQHKKIEAEIRANRKKKKNHSTELGALTSSKSNISPICWSPPTHPQLLLGVIWTWQEFEHALSSSVML